MDVSMELLGKSLFSKLNIVNSIDWLDRFDREIRIKNLHCTKLITYWI